MTFTPTDPTPVYYEDLSKYVVSTPKGNIDLTMRDVLRDINKAPRSK